MKTIRHKQFGEGTIIKKEPKEIGSYITVRFDMIDKELRFAIPESFKTGLFMVDSDMEKEINDVIAEKREKERIEFEEKKNSILTSKCSNLTFSHGVWNHLTSVVDSWIRDDFKKYLIDNGYAEITPSGSGSTAPQYVRAVEHIIKEECLTWSTLALNLVRVISLYDQGGAKETLGNTQHRT